MVWCANLGYPSTSFPREGDYYANSPSTGKRTKYNDTEIWNEIVRLIQKDKKHLYTIGNNLYYNIPLFADVSRFEDPNIDEWMETYKMVKEFNTPLARSIDETPMISFEALKIIDQETRACSQHLLKLKGATA